jgi:hypothetical protein
MKFRELFDRDRTFLVNKPMVMNGIEYGYGEEFPKTAVTTRRLRQLYDAHWLQLAPPSNAEKPILTLKKRSAPQ